MGKYTFTWEHAASQVFVTGTFDGWKETVKLDKEDGVFKKTVELPKAHTQYKFIVDGHWRINESARKADDGNGIVNNVLEPNDIIDEPVGTFSSAAPESTTAALAGAVPKEKDSGKTQFQGAVVPGAFPMTPAAETPGSEPQTFNINPIPATEGAGNPIKLAPGEPVPDPSTFTNNTVQSTVKDDKQDEEPEAQSFGVAPLPATAGAGNPIHLAPGEKVPDPSTFTSNTVQSTAKTDPASYSKSDALPALPDLGLTPQAERDAKGGMFSLPPISGNMIPESSLPMGRDAETEKDPGFSIQSAGPTSTTAKLAGQVPKEPRGVPEIVSESRKEAGFAPEATTNPEAVQEKKEVEQELRKEVSETPAAADNSYISQVSSGVGKAATTAAAGATAGAGLFTAAIYNAKDKAFGANGSAMGDVKPSAPHDLDESASGDVPSIVSKSQHDAHVGPEASANAKAVDEKSQLEQELLSKLPKTNETGAPAPSIAIPAVVSESQQIAHASPEAAAYSEVVAEKKAVESELLKEIPKAYEAGEPAPVFTAATSTTASGAATAQEPALNVPDVVAESQKEAHASPEASANRAAVSEKQAVESELLREIPKTNEAGEPAPVITAATSATAPGLKSESPAPNAPRVVAESYKEAHASPEAAANIEAVDENKTNEVEMLEEVKKSTAAAEHDHTIAATSTNAAALSDDALVDSKPLKSSSEPDALNAPASKPALPPTSKPIDSNTNVSFAAKEPTTTEQTQSTVTTGTETTTTAPTTEAASSATPVTPQKDLRKDSDISPKGTPGSQSIASGADDKKKKRRSIFGKIKDKLSSKN